MFHLQSHIRLIVALTLAVIVCLPSTLLALLVDSDNTNLNPDGTIPIEDQAPVGMRPDDNLAVKIGNRFSAVPIAPNYILTAAHWKSPGSGWIGLRVRVGRGSTFLYEIVDSYDYRMDDSILNSGQVTSNLGAYDVVVLKIAPLNAGSPPSLTQWVNLYDGQEITGMSFARGSYGKQRKRLIPDGTLVGQPSNYGTLAWGMDRIEHIGPFNLSGTSLDTLLTNPTSYAADFYTRYESALISDDSGSGWYFQDGWEWKINGTTLTTGLESVSGTRMSLPSSRDWIDQAIIAMGGTMTPAPTVPPTPDKIWSGLADENWSTGPGNWLDNAPPSAAHTVRIADASHDANISSAPALAAQLFVGNAGIQGTLNITNDQPLDVSGGIFLGPQPSDTGNLNILSNSNLSAENLYVGVYGSGNFTQSGGTLNINSIMYIGFKSAGSGYASIVTTTQDFAVLNAYSVVLGHYAGSSGTLDIGDNGADAVPLLNTTTLYVGNSGDATFRQIGASEVIVNNLFIANNPASSGSYQLNSSAATLNTHFTSVGVNGLATFTHNNGLHITQYLNIDESSSYHLLGGTLNAADGVSTLGTFNFGNSSATLIAGGYIDLGLADLQDADNASITVNSQSLLVLPAGTDPQTDIGDLNLGSQSVVHIEGNTLLVDQNDHLAIHGTIRDDILIQDNAFLSAAPSGKNLALLGNLAILNTSTVDLGNGGSGVDPSSYNITSADRTLDLNNGQLTTGAIHISPTRTLTANGTIQLRWMTPGNSKSRLTLDENAILDIGPGIAHLQIIGGFQLAPTSTLRMDIASTSQFDSLTITNFTSANTVFDGTLELHFLNDFLPNPGAQFPLITYISHLGEFNAITHDGPVGLIVTGLFNNPTSTFSVSFSAWHTGDADLDGDIDASDLLTLKSNFGMTSATWYDGDFNNNGTVDVHDFIAVKNNFGLTMSPPGLNFIPQPTSAALFSLTSLFLLRRHSPPSNRLADSSHPRASSSNPCPRANSAASR